MIDKIDLSIKAASIRKKLGEDESSPINIFALAHTINSLTLVFYPLGQNISGACIKSNLSSIIAINSGMSAGRQRFSLSHELYHLFFDTGMSSSICSSKIGSGNKKEKEADQFASYLLMPPTALYDMIRSCKNSDNRKLTMMEIVKLEQYFGVSRQAMLFRLQSENEITPTEAANMQKDVILSAARFGFDTALYKPLPEDKKRCVYGHYIQQAEKLLQADMISTGKYEELLLDAFRDDIVFGDEEGGETVD
ncbi:MAG TPA: toxin-antitoxin system, toxin component [Ruminococcaceae bacterium]|nr:toxin-antitoxin system, toxin component [Oscillospiraceae bacterium]